MSKKQELAVLDKATVSNNINLNLNQNDLIDLAIQDHLETLETKLKSVKEEMDSVKANIELLKKGLCKEYAIKSLKGNKEYNKYLEITKGMTNSDPRYNLYFDNKELLGEYKNYGSSEPTTLAQFTRNCYATNFYKFKCIGGDVSLTSIFGQLYVEFSSKLTLTEAQKNVINTKLEPLNERYYDLLKLKHELEKEYWEYTFGEKKIKAKIVKASLKKTAEGQAILGMLQGATGVKLLG